PIKFIVRIQRTKYWNDSVDLSLKNVRYDNGQIEQKGKGEMQTWWVVKRTRAEVDHDVCPLPTNFLRKKKKPPTTVKLNIMEAV
ncbi:hypothetical protein AHF37_12579, partial [Paragonimus kellicotti]